MNILFLTISGFDSIEDHTIYADLLRSFRNHGHNVFVISPYEKRTGKVTELICENDTQILRIATGNVTGPSNLIKKGVAQLSIEKTYIRGIKKYFSKVNFDLVLYSTPPITFCKAVEYVKKRDGARTYLLLKDIFPQNAVDLGMMKTTGPKSFLYKYFRKKEKRLYGISDRIGCMSPANVRYLINHNAEVDSERVGVCPNSIEVFDKSVDSETRDIIRKEYGIPLNKKVFVYGGNLGKPQGIPFLIKCLTASKDIKDAFFLIVGSGTEYPLLNEYINQLNCNNVLLMESIPKEDYDKLVGACDVGMIFLDYRFTIPNIPSRLLSYLQAKLPVLAVTDPNTDIGEIIESGGFGWWCESCNVSAFKRSINLALNANTDELGARGYLYLQKNYSAEKGYEIITDALS